jgi:hypothetical protein
MKPNSLLTIITCLFLGACNIPQTTSVETDVFEVPSVDPTGTTQFGTLTYTPTTQYPSETSDPVSTDTPTVSPTITSEFTNTPEPGFGGIEGSILGYPYGAIPRLVIVAFKKEPPYPYRYEILVPGSSYYSMTAGVDYYLSTGKYQVVAYDASGHAGGCNTIIEVKKDQMVTCDITNWGGSYPSKPGDVP